MTTVILGGQEYQIEALPVAESRKWRATLVEAMGRLPSFLNVSTADPAKFSEGVSGLLGGMPDAVIDLFFNYARKLPREEIEQKATDAEIAVSFEQVVTLALPLTRSVGSALSSLAR